MSKASTTIKLARVNTLLRSWNYVVTEEPGAWSRESQPPKEWATGEPEGLVNHHFVIGLSKPMADGVRNVTHGDANLAGPKCNWYVHESQIRFIAYGPANHAGSGDSKVLERVSRGLPYVSTGPDNYSGNKFYLGQESHHPGDTTAWPAKLVEHVVALNAACCLVFGWNQNHCINHKWHTRRKIDMSSSFPGNIQDLTAQFIRNKTGPTPLPPEEEEEMYLKLVRVATDPNQWWLIDPVGNTRKRMADDTQKDFHKAAWDIQEISGVQAPVVLANYRDISGE